MLSPCNQTKLFGFNKIFKEFTNLYDLNKFPNKILFSGQKGIGKATLSYHLINFILSKDEEFSYELRNFSINNQNRSFKLIQNKTHPNFNLIDVMPEKMNIDINQIRQLLSKFNKSSLNSKPRFILIDNIELLNISSVNALLKFLEEPSVNTYFILIHNHKDIPNTLRSRCLEFKIFFSNNESLDISSKLLNEDVFNLINKDLLNYYLTPGKIYNLYQLCYENNIDIKDINLNDFLLLLIDKKFYRKNTSMNSMLYDFIEVFLKRNLKKDNNFSESNDFFKRKYNVKKFNLDEESLFIHFKEKILHG
tara:strand:- start:1554 stop:2474 length:921 start_codon:yes stop_codon:yes gene_type:complete